MLSVLSRSIKVGHLEALRPDFESLLEQWGSQETREGLKIDGVKSQTS